ncbi:MAG: DUF1080 domain-containing protein [Verrucomicrobia bacterium]|nr:DUF1080 domain-containing protein [Verrucomicrobiota bacterium]
MNENLLSHSAFATILHAGAITLALTLPPRTLAQHEPAWKVHDWERPRPPVIDPGTASTATQPGKPSSDATVLFDGKDLSAWASLDGTLPKWIVKDGVMECVKDSGYVRTLQNFGDCQLHIEWAAPVPAQGESQGRGNSGVFLMGFYEVQVLDSHENKTYADGQAAAVYGQYPPLVNAARPPGQWQSYDIIFTRPRFNEKGQLVSPARLTVLHNGVLVQHNVSLWGGTAWMSHAGYRPHPDKLPLSLQDHGNPVRFRNIWVRDLEGGPAEFTYATNVLERLVGTYEVNKDTAIVVTRKDTQLTMSVVHPERRHSYALFTGSPTEFFAKSVDSGLAFQVSAGGTVEGLKFRMAGETRPAKKVK